MRDVRLGPIQFCACWLQLCTSCGDTGDWEPEPDARGSKPVSTSNVLDDPSVQSFSTRRIETETSSSLSNLTRQRLLLVKAPVILTDPPPATMVKIFRLLTLALVMSAGGGVLSLPVAEESTKGTTSDLDTGARTPSTSGNVRGADGFDLLGQDGGEERGAGNMDNLVEGVASRLPKLPPLKVSVGQADDMVTQALKTKSRLDRFNIRVQRAKWMMDKKSTIALMHERNVSPRHVQKALLLRVKKSDKDGLLASAVAKQTYKEEAEAIEKEFAALVRKVEKNENKVSAPPRGVVMDRTVK